MDGNVLGTAIKNAINALSQAQKENLEFAWQTICIEIAIEHNNDVIGAGFVIGPASAINENLPSFDGTTGKILKDSGLSTADLSDAITKKHTHANITVLDAITNAGSGLIITGTERTNWDNHLSNTSNPHVVTKSQIGLGNVDDLQQIPLTYKGAANGVAELDSNTKVPIAQLPNSVSETSKFHQGTFVESFDALVTSNGTIITMSLEQSGGGDLTTIFSSGLATLNCTPAKTIVLTVGTDSVPQENFIYILESAPSVLVKSTSAWPITEHIKIAYLFVQSAVRVQSDGALTNQNWNDHVYNENNSGHLTSIGRWIREQPAKYKSGVEPAGDAGTYIVTTTGPDRISFKSASGTISQLHLHIYSAKDTTIGGGDDTHVINNFTTPYAEISDLLDITEDALGNTIGINKYFNLIIVGVANKTGEYSPLLINLPTGVYSSLNGAEGDTSGYDVYSLPDEFIRQSGTGFLICRLTFKRTPTTWQYQSSVDLRGTNPTNVTGGTAPGGAIVNFNDTLFTWFNNVDSTKIVNVDLSGLTTGTTKTLTMPDESGTLITDSTPEVSQWNTAYGWGDHSGLYLLLSGGGAVTGDVKVSGSLSIGTVTAANPLLIANENTNAIPTDHNLHTNAHQLLTNLHASGVYTGIGFIARASGQSRGLIALEYQSANAGDFVFRLRDGASTSIEVMRLKYTGVIEIPGSLDVTSRITTNKTWDADDEKAGIFLNGATGNRIEYNSNGSAIPAFTTRSAGTKIVFVLGISGTTVDIGIGATTVSLWNSIKENTNSYSFRWYAGITQLMRLTGGTIPVLAITGRLSVSVDIIANATNVSIFTRSGGAVLRLDRGEDGTIMQFQSASSTEGSISIAGTVCSYNTFMGSHVSVFNGLIQDLKEGQVLVSTGELIATKKEENSRFTKVSHTNKKADRSVYGVYFSRHIIEKDIDAMTLNYKQDEIFVAALGLFKIRVTDTNGNINKGDYLQSSERIGESEKQDDDILRSSTIAKALVDINWSNINIDIELNYKWKLIPCTLHCG